MAFHVLGCLLSRTKCMYIEGAPNTHPKDPDLVDDLGVRVYYPPSRANDYSGVSDSYDRYTLR